MANMIFSITKENGVLMARQNKQITSLNELDDLIDKLYDSWRFFLDLRYRLGNDLESSLAYVQKNVQDLPIVQPNQVCEVAKENLLKRRI